jgi:hypothetical protein
VQPIYIHIPSEIDPGIGFKAHPGTVNIHIGEPIDTSTWRAEDAALIKEQVRELYIHWKEELDG